jgi:hypothetical protein
MSDIERIIETYNLNKSDNGAAQALIDAIARRHGFAGLAVSPTRSLLQCPIAYEDCLKFTQIVAGSELVETISVGLTQKNQRHGGASSVLDIKFKLSNNVVFSFYSSATLTAMSQIMLTLFLGRRSFKPFHMFFRLGTNPKDGFEMLQEHLENAKTGVAWLQTKAAEDAKNIVQVKVNTQPLRPEDNPFKP